MRNKIILTLALLLIVAALFTGCSGSRPTDKTLDESSAVAEPAVTTAQISSELPPADTKPQGEEEKTSSLSSEAETSIIPTTEIPASEQTEPSTEEKYNEAHINFSDLE